ncbi:hypothetical protein, partial [Methylobacterium variabile]|uniref:hypothetical protein n=1 Tax=Methylobacterium variabile TaxID=298794 RepID=UPI000B093A4D
GQLAQVRGLADAVEEGENQIGQVVTLAVQGRTPLGPDGRESSQLTAVIPQAAGRAIARLASVTVAAVRRATTPKNILNPK